MSLEPRPRRDLFQGLLSQTLGWVLLVFTGMIHAQTARIGYVDMQRLIDSAPQVRQARQRLQSEFAARDDLLRQERVRLSQLQQRFDTLPADTTAQSREALQNEINSLKRSITRTSERMRSELEARSSEEVDRAWPQINEAVIDYANEQGFDLILPGPVVFANDRVDITDQVLHRLQTDELPDNSP